MSHDNITGKSKGYCFIEYETPAMAEAAMVVAPAFFHLSNIR